MTQKKTQRLLNHAQRVKQAQALLKALSEETAALPLTIRHLDDARLALDAHLDLVTQALGAAILAE